MSRAGHAPSEACAKSLGRKRLSLFWELKGSQSGLKQSEQDKGEMNRELEGKAGASRTCTECGFYFKVNMKPSKVLTEGNGISRFTMSKDHSDCLVEKGLHREGTRRFVTN